MMNGYGTVDTAIEAMRAGAFHYLAKPFQAEEVLHLVDKAYVQRQLKRENLFLKSESRSGHLLHSVVGTSAPIQEVVAAVQRLSDTDTPVLLAGATGPFFFPKSGRRGKGCWTASSPFSPTARSRKSEAPRRSNSTSG